MKSEKIARLSSAKVTFIPQEKGASPVELAYQQNVTLSRSSETKELLSNDESIAQAVMEIETKSEYTFSTEIGNVSLDALALCFKGVVNEKTYEVGGKDWLGRAIKAHTEKLTIGDIALKEERLYVVTEAMNANSFDESKVAPKSYPKTMRVLRPQIKPNTLGKIVVDGVNLATGAPQILIIPQINLRFEGDIAVSGDDFVKLSLKGKVIKLENEDLFTLIDG